MAENFRKLVHKNSFHKEKFAMKINYFDKLLKKFSKDNPLLDFNQIKALIEKIDLNNIMNFGFITTLSNYFYFLEKNNLSSILENFKQYFISFKFDLEDILVFQNEKYSNFLENNGIDQQKQNEFKELYDRIENNFLGYTNESLLKKIVKFIMYHYYMFSANYSILNILIYNDNFNLLYYLFCENVHLSFKYFSSKIYLYNQSFQNINFLCYVYNFMNSISKTRLHSILIINEDEFPLFKPISQIECLYVKIDINLDFFSFYNISSLSDLTIYTDINNLEKIISKLNFTETKIYFKLKNMKNDEVSYRLFSIFYEKFLKNTDFIVYFVQFEFKGDLISFENKFDKIILKIFLNINTNSEKFVELTEKIFTDIYPKLENNFIFKIKVNYTINENILNQIIYPKRLLYPFTFLINTYNVKLICQLVKTTKFNYSIHSDIKYYFRAFHGILKKNYENNMIDEGYESDAEIIFPTLNRDLSKKFINKKISKSVNHFLISKVTFDNIYLLETLDIEYLFDYIDDSLNYIIFFQYSKFIMDILKCFISTKVDNGFIISIKDLENLLKFNSNLEFLKFDSAIIFRFPIDFVLTIDDKIISSIIYSFFSSKVLFLIENHIFEFFFFIYFNDNMLHLFFRNKSELSKLNNRFLAEEFERFFGEKTMQCLRKFLKIMYTNDMNINFLISNREIITFKQKFNRIKLEIPFQLLSFGLKIFVDFLSEFYSFRVLDLKIQRFIFRSKTFEDNSNILLLRKMRIVKLKLFIENEMLDNPTSINFFNRNNLIYFNLNCLKLRLNIENLEIIYNIFSVLDEIISPDLELNISDDYQYLTKDQELLHTSNIKNFIKNKKFKTVKIKLNSSNLLKSTLTTFKNLIVFSKNFCADFKFALCYNSKALNSISSDEGSELDDLKMKKAEHYLQKHIRDNLKSHKIYIYNHHIFTYCLQNPKIMRLRNKNILLNISKFLIYKGSTTIELNLLDKIN